VFTFDLIMTIFKLLSMSTW